MDILLKSTILVTLFYTCYVLFLRKETFFQSNRAFLDFGLVLTLILPWITIPVYITKPLPVLSYENLAQVQSLEVVGNTAVSWSWENLFLVLYLVGISVFLIKFLIELFSLKTMISKGHTIKKDGYSLVEIKENVSPFSFFKSIVFNPDSFGTEELAQIIEHEKVHVRQGHSYDIIFMRIMCIMNWFNPVVWLYQSAVEQNLEFIADNSAKRVSGASNFYHKLLLNSAVPEYRLILANNFFNSLIKKRIVMLQKQRSNRSNQLKMTLILPLLTLFLMSFSTKEIVTYEAPENEVNSGLMQLNDADDGETIEVIVSKDMSENDLDKLVSEFKKMDITLKFKGVKRNSSGDITAIEISVKSDKSSANYSSNSDDGINPITIRVKDGSISIGDGKVHEDHNLFEYKTGEDGSVWIHKGDKTSGKVHLFSDDDEHIEIYEEDGKTIIKSDKAIFISEDGKTKEIKKIGKDGSAIFIQDSDDEGEVEIIEIEGGDDGHGVFIKKVKDGKVIKEWIDKKDGNVWVIEDDDENEIKANKIVIRNVGKDKIHIAGDSEDALILLDGKEISKEEANDLDSDNIESVEVLKGKKAEEKYGKKAKNGVVIIKTKE